MGRKLRYLGLDERETIEHLHKGGATASLIAERIGTTPATVCRELKLGQLTEAGVAVKDEFGRLIYSAERGQRAFEAAMKRRGRRASGQ